MPICDTIIGIKVAELNGGTITTEQVNKMKIHRSFLRVMVDKGLLNHSARGVYVLPAKLDDEFYNLQIRFKKVCFQIFPRCICWASQTEVQMKIIGSRIDYKSIKKSHYVRFFYERRFITSITAMIAVSMLIMITLTDIFLLSFRKELSRLPSAFLVFI